MALVVALEFSAAHRASTSRPNSASPAVRSSTAATPYFAPNHSRPFALSRPPLLLDSIAPCLGPPPAGGKQTRYLVPDITASTAALQISDSPSPRADERRQQTSSPTSPDDPPQQTVIQQGPSGLYVQTTGERIRPPEPSLLRTHLPFAIADRSDSPTALPTTSVSRVRRPEQRHSHRRSLLNTLFPPSRSQRQRSVQQPASRLWNPINHNPRTTLVSRPRTPPLSDTAPHPDKGGGREAYPLLTLPEQRRSRGQSPSSLVVERSADGEGGSGRTSIGLPPGKRRSVTAEELGIGTATPKMGVESEQAAPSEKQDPTIQQPAQAHLPPPSQAQQPTDGPLKPHPNTTDLSRDPELGYKYAPENTIHAPRHVQSERSLRPQTFASSSQAAPLDGPHGSEDYSWGPSHPCFPHLNPHVPISSTEYASTRIIRIRRDWMVAGDLAPTFSNLYPEILDPMLPEQEFRTLIAKINKELVLAFDPYGWRNWFDAAMGVLTGWLWEDVGATAVKGRLKDVEHWIQSWNRDTGAKEGVMIWGLRRTGYLSLDIQIPDPHVGIVSSEAASRPESRPESRRSNEAGLPAQS